MLQHLEDVVASEACVVRQSSETAPPPTGSPEYRLQRGDGGINVQVGQCDDDETFDSKLI